MELKRMKGACWAQVQETYAGSSLGFPRKNKSIKTNCKKGGVTVWLS